MLALTAVTSTQFDTERFYGYVTIDGSRHSGSDGFNNVVVAAGSTFTWTSDGSVNNTG